MFSPTGYYANFVHECWKDGKFDGRFIDTLPVVCFEQGSAVVATDDGELTKAKDLLAECNKEHAADTEAEGTWKAHLEVSPYVRDEE